MAGRGGQRAERLCAEWQGRAQQQTARTGGVARGRKERELQHGWINHSKVDTGQVLYGVRVAGKSAVGREERECSVATETRARALEAKEKRCSLF